MELSSQKFRRYVLVFWVVMLIPILLCIFFYIGICSGWFGYMPKLDDLDNPVSNLASEVYSSDGILMGTYYIQNRNTCEYKEFPDYLVHALVAREDHRFYNHSGIDVKGLGRVFFKTVLLGKIYACHFRPDR